jgi:CheY-like chemotaxis protein
VDKKMSKTIWIVDDESRILYTVKHGLEALDKEIHVKTMDRGQTCLDLLGNETPDLILLDLNMPEMSGWLVYDSIRDNPQWNNIPIVFLTARTDDIARKAGKFMADSYLEKPVDIIELKRKIDELVKK